MMKESILNEIELFRKLRPGVKIDIICHPLVLAGNGLLINKILYINKEDMYKWIFAFGVNEESISAAILFGQEQNIKFIESRIKVLTHKL